MQKGMRRACHSCDLPKPTERVSLARRSMLARRLEFGTDQQTLPQSREPVHILTTALSLQDSQSELQLATRSSSVARSRRLGKARLALFVFCSGNFVVVSDFEIRISDLRLRRATISRPCNQTAHQYTPASLRQPLGTFQEGGIVMVQKCDTCGRTAGRGNSK